MIGEQQRIADRHLRSGEAVGAEELRLLEQGVQRAQPRQEPAGVVLDDLLLLALGGLVAPVTQDQGLGKRQRRLAEMQEVEVGAERVLARLDIQVAG